MSRSFHTTRRDLEREKEREHRSQEERARAIKRLHDDLIKKRQTKRYVRYHRRGSWPETGHTPIDLIPIERHDVGEYLHFPASEDDLRELMHRLPAGVADGLEGISLCLGEKKQTECISANDDEEKGDPYSGRIGFEILPGVYVGSCLGIYYAARSEIHLFGYVYPPNLPDRPMWEVYMRLHLLMTFVHEIAHHYDLTFRLARGRWRADNKDNVEIYAEKIQHQWVEEYVIPFLREKYPEQLHQLEQWLEREVGVKVPLELLAGDPRETGKNGSIRLGAFFDTAEAFRDFVEKRLANGDIWETRLEYADKLHMAEEYAVAMQIVELVLTANPKHVDALTLKAEIHEHLEEYEAGIEVIMQALAINPKHIEGLRVMAEICEGLGRWQDVIDAADKIITLLHNKSHWRHTSAQGMKANAYWEMGKREKTDSIIAELEKGDLLGMRRMAQRLRAEFDNAEASP